MAENLPRRAKLFVDEGGKSMNQAPLLRVIKSGDAAVQHAASVVLALLIVVSLTAHGFTAAHTAT